MHKTSYITIWIFYFFAIGFAQEKKLEYSQNLTISEGLAHNGVTSILEDARGYMWVGTYDGLNSYNGYEFKVFKNTVEKNLLVSNRVRTISEMENGELWIGTDDGITAYNYILERFTNVYANKLIGKGINGPIVRKILTDKQDDSVLCATEDNGLLLFKTDHTFIKRYVPPKGFHDEPISFLDGLALDSNNYLFSTSAGLVLFKKNKEEFLQIFENDVTASTAILQLDSNTLLATLSNGIVVFGFDKSGDTYSFESAIKKMETERFNSAALDKNGKLWLGTMTNGVVQIENIAAFKKEPTYSVSSYAPESGLLRTSCVYPSENNGCWIGTFNKGLFRFNLDANPFKKYMGGSSYDFSIHQNNVTYITALDSHRVLMTASLDRIALFNTTSAKFEPLPFNLPNDDKFNVSSAFVDSRNNIWMMLRENGGLIRVKDGQTDWENLDSYENTTLLAEGTIRSITEDKYGNIWIATANNIFKISISNANTITQVQTLDKNPYFQKNKLSLIRRIYVDPLYDFLWMGTDADGLFRLDIDNKTPLSALEVKQYISDKSVKNSLSSNFVSDILRLPNDELWISTERGGICKVIDSETDPKFISFSEKDGLSNNVVKSLRYDKEGNLWAATNIGLNKYNLTDHTLRTFGKEDGLPFDDFWYASTALDDGTLLFSGLEGFCYFSPKDISEHEALPQLQFGDLKIFNHTVVPGDTIDGRVLLDKNISAQDQLNLKYDENVFSIELASLHYSNPENHKLKYKLIPIDEEWIEVPSSRRFVTYNGLQPGKYTLTALASNSANEWSEPKTLKIVIAPPWWKTVQAYVLYVILTLLILGTVLYYILKLQGLRHNVVIEQLEKNKEKEVNLAKLRFFANISHELKTPINLINSPLKILSNRFKGNVDVSEKLGLIERQSKKISQLISQVHDFERADANLLEMEYSRFYFDTFLKDLIVDFKFLAENNHKELNVVAKNSNIIVSADRDKLEKVFNNILSNAFKYTGENDVIAITYESNDKDLIVSVSDTGRGIDKADLPHIFERFYQSHKKENAHTSGSGIGLAFSKRLVEMHYGYITVESMPNKGTTIFVRLPIVKKESAEDQTAKKKAIISAENEQVVEEQLAQKIDASVIEASGNYSENVIFYVEDNLDMRLYVSKILSQFFKVKTFNNGKECFDAMENQWPDMVISDIQMPIMNGLDLCKRIKSDMKTSHIPVILLTAFANIEDQLQGIRDGADAYIKKPFDPRHLIARTEALLENRKRLRERFEIGIPLAKDNNINRRNDSAFLEKLYHLMSENLDNQALDMDQFARKLYLNRTHFYQKVKALTNKTPFELLKMYRLKKAAELLIQKQELSVNEVYIMTGFKSRTHFSKLFKEKYKVSPGQYSSSIKQKSL
ncbi:hybrid sensor histidine kinase/response regulator transcription factor [Kriegella aquimaris]|uniref:histidine kinase n=1 Tax=Kriegella aquimaris TaxID=192904 RepID=A0A1G9KI61_9FLAO|nr:hybrid sensor histidine kinase/response regulator transcription factor [Kriegella aquimaris]SDL49302.1 Signal transduction histidine kinase [Kriegella aquimaris]